MAESFLSPTPTATKVILVATFASTVAALSAYVASAGAGTAQGAAPYLVGFTVLFLVRVAGQVFVRARRPGWLPPTEQWNLSPYRVLLPTQVAMLALMIWIDTDFARDRGFWTEPRPSVGIGVLWFAAFYAAAMAIRYIVRMTRRRDQRWFGGTIPIVFHWVLAAYLLVFGSVHASR